ncbi:hypothetical protein Nepgr_026050 [Nepenthes gracilis]|uniref:VQ domain-containing protein n=1 Tax=Nepenthes gracilis TaxID=150966 RepID=A0AAD3Y019_NEPGR|nr:hypothetical protein Nepgr_026050 [Nepenthes gracilis]
MGSRMTSAVAGPMKVVYINTQYVETDAVSFKSVVQRLTGKDSTAAMDSSKQCRRFRKAEELDRGGPVGGGGELPAGIPLLMREFSFKETDELLKELPPLDDDLHRLFTN